MGEVYRARDERIGRDVAIKILPPTFAESEDRLSRFESEARAAGALNHPNLVTIYELGRHDGAPFIAMELLEGHSLRGLLDEKGAGAAKDDATRVSPIPQRKAIEYAVQIATGLAAAHDRGVVHRDLKPENIFVTTDGRVKILDFGLAKQTGVESGDQQDAATQKRDTAPGTVMGTVGYMSPEQVRGQAVDHRTDIFSFGAVLYEMLTGRRAFRGDSQVETMNAILKEDPPELASTRGSGVSGVSPALEHIVRHCLEKNRNERFHSMHDVAFALGHFSSLSGQVEALSSAPSPDSRFPLRLVAAVALVALAAGAAVGWMVRRPGGAVTGGVSQIPPQILRPFSFSGHDLSPVVSPDGKMVAFSSSRDGRPRIWLRQISGGGELALTEGPDSFPSFSPDGATILFVRQADNGSSDIYRVAALGGTARKIIEDGNDAAWSPDGKRIAVLRQVERKGGYDTVVMLVGADGSGLTTLATIKDIAAKDPRWSPDGTRIAVSDQSPGYRNRRPSLIGIDGKVSEPKLLDNAGLHSNVAWIDNERVVMAEVTSTTYAPSGMGSRVFLKNLVTGESTVLLYTQEPVFRVDVTPDGRVVADQIIVRQNLHEVPLPGVAGAERWLTRGTSQDRQPAYARDGKSVVFSTTMSGNLDIWSVSTEDGALRRLTEDVTDDFDPALSPDGKHLIWSSRRSGNYEIWIANADGTEARQLTRDGVDAENPTMTPDGQWVVYNSYNAARAGIWKIHPDGKGDTRIANEGTAQLPEISPDGKWVAYSTSMVGTRYLSVVSIDGGEVYRVNELIYPPAAGMAGNFSPGRARWSADGKSLAYLDCVQSGACGLRLQQFEFGRDTRAARRDLTPFDLFAPPESFSLSPDGKRMVLSANDQAERIVITDPIAMLARGTSTGSSGNR
jgi:Tol biopolymer transport system component